MLAAVPDRPPLIRKRRVRPPPSKLEPRSHRPRSASRSVGGASWFFHGDPPSAIHGGKLAPVSIRQLGGRVPAPFQFQDVVPALLNYT
uniref:Uncharacterized protein n=1 Tax=Oryza rufipogon TaxID=4529 RepID=A0A0E0NDH3_ORYRU